MKSSDSQKDPASAYRKLLNATAAGLVAGVAVGIFGNPQIIPLVIWDTIAVIYTVWTWWSIWPLNAQQTDKLANREDPGRGITDVILILASVASLIAVALVLIQGSNSNSLSKGLFGGLGIISVILSWLVIHTLYTLKYAELYYRGKIGGVNFNQKAQPRYSDFAYLSFTLGMTFQVSDTTLTSNNMRRAALHQAHLAYFFGTVIIATTINLVVGLSK